MKVVVIGAGAAGLAAIKNSLDFKCEVIAFEQSDTIGGTWVYTDNVGKDERGLDVHSSMYKLLRSNLPIELMCYPNEPFPENELSFVSSDEVLKYYESYADKYNLRDYIRFEYYVVRVRPLSDDSWEVIVKNLKTKALETHNFDAVLVCNGHFSWSFIPNYQGRDIFTGRQIHSHHYRSADAFKDEDVLVIGGNLSAVDIVLQTAKCARSVTWSHHMKFEPDLSAFDGDVIQKPDVARFNEHGPIFVDTTEARITSIIYCTGYEYKFPFLSVDCGISTVDNYVKPLFKHCVNINRPTLAFIGLNNLICPNQLFDLQSRFSLTFINGRKQLPTKEEMLRDSEEDLERRWKLGLPSKKAHIMGAGFQYQYYIDLAETAGIEPIKPVIVRMQEFTNLSRDRDHVNYRRRKFHIIDDNTFETRDVQ